MIFSSRRQRIGAIGTILLLAVGFATFVWPTRYRAIAIAPREPSADMPALAVREDRFTGVVQVLTVWGWVTPTLPTTPGDSLRALARKYGK